MGKTTIEWTDFTFNLWWGCVEVSDECDECYARTFAKRLGMDLWGKDAPRRFFGDAYWDQPIAWNAEAQAIGRRMRVFCASMADICERHGNPETMAQMDAARRRLVQLIFHTPYLDWLLLTKRPQDFIKLFPEWARRFPSNVWPGVTCGYPDVAWRLDTLCDLPPAYVKFVSYEPALRGMDFRPWFGRGLNWVIAGGEGRLQKSASRPPHPQWIRTARDHAVQAGVSFLFKQWGDWLPIDQMADSSVWYRSYPPSRKYPEGRQVCKVPRGVLQLDGTIKFDFPAGAMSVYCVGKPAAGRLLDGREWNQIPFTGESAA